MKRLNHLIVEKLVIYYIIFGIVASCQQSSSQKNFYKVGIAQFVSVPPLDDARKGFIAALAEEGFVEGKNIEFEIDNPETDMSVAATIAKKFTSQRKDLILSISTPMSQACVSASRYTTIPIIFSSVTDPVSAGLVDNLDRPGGRITGVSDWADVLKQIELIKEICPYVLKLGVLYNAGETNSKVQIEELRKIAPQLNITIIETHVSSSTDVMAGAKSLVGKVDALWVPTDNVVIGAMEAVVKVAEDNKIPFFGSDVSQVERGAIASAGIDFNEIGRISGKMAARILKGEKPGNIPIPKGAMKLLYLNTDAAKRMGVTIPNSVFARATKIIKQ